MASSPQHEPTMEEILASIRKIISEDSTEATPPVSTVAAPAPAPAPQPAPVAKTPEPTEEKEEEVLELTQEVREPEPIKTAEDMEFKTIEEPSPPVSSSDIFSDKTRKVIDEAFAKLDGEEEVKPSAPTVMSAAFRGTAVEGDSVEAVFERAVRDAVGPHIDQWMGSQKDALLAAMKPLIREWMDEHFPAILEGAVRDEVARAVKARGKR